MNKELLNFHLSTFIFLGISFFIHSYIVNTEHLLFLYAINMIIAFFIYWAAYLFQHKQKEYLGFYFLAGTFLKFFVFFTIVLPIFKNDDVFSKIEFFSFFVPYLISLIIETKSLISLVKQTEK